MSLGQLFVIKDNKEICYTHYDTTFLWETTTKIKSANYGTVAVITTHHIEIRGIENMNCHLAGNKTNIVLNDKDGINKYYDCLVQNFYDDGYELTYSKVKKIN